MLAAQSLVLGVSMFVVILVMLMSIFLPRASSASEKMMLAGSLLAIAIPVLCVKVYAMQCVIYGSCDAFAWVAATVAVAVAVAYLAFFLIKTKRSREEKHNL